MWRFLLRRVLQAAVVTGLVATITFALIHLAPGDPFTGSLADSRVPEAAREYWRKQYGVDRPIPEQYWRWLASIAVGKLGISYSQHRPVRDALADAIPRTAVLMGCALAVSFALGIAIGVVQARRRGSLADRALGAASLFFYSMPDFWLALVLLLLVAHWPGVLPTGGDVDPLYHGYMGPWGRFVDRLRHLVLPVTALALLTAAAVARYQRAAVLDVAGQDFVRTARAKGLDERRVATRHVLRNALLPVITLLGLALPALLAGAVFVEQIFSWPGMGRLAVEAIAQRDYPLVMAVVLIGGVLVSVGGLVADLLQLAADPRLRNP